MHKYFLLPTLLCILLSFSCLFPATDEYISTSETKILSLGDTIPVTINSEDLVNRASTTLKFNRTGEKHLYSVYELPATTPKKTSPSLTKLTLNLETYKEEDLKTKSFFLVASDGNSNNSPEQGVSRNDLSSIKTRNIRSQKQPQKRHLAQQSPQNSNTFDFDTAIEYDPSLDNLSEANKRTFLFDAAASSPDRECTTLYKKIETTIESKNIQIALWIDRSPDGDPINGVCTDKDATGDYFSRSDDIKIKQIFDIFAEDFFGNTDSIYSTVYQINNNHYWGPHTNTHALDENAVLHIGFGNLNMNEESVTSGFIEPAQLFTYNFLYSTKEEVPGLTIYLNLRLLQNSARIIDISTNPQDLITLYTTFVHELQHIATVYLRGVKAINTTDAIKYGSTWFAEFIAITIEHLLYSNISSKLLSRYTPRLGEPDIKRSFLEYMIQNRSVFREYNHNVFFNGITASDFNVDNYETTEIFASYLINNYGVELITNIMNSNQLGQKLTNNEEAIFEAIRSSNTFYQAYEEDVRPESFADVIHDFHVASFLSIPTQSDDRSIGPYKMYIYDGDANSSRIKDQLSFGTIVVAPSKSGQSLQTVSYNLASSPPPTNTMCAIGTTVANCDLSDTYTYVSPENTGTNDSLDFNNTWLEGAGPVLTTLRTPRRKLVDSKADFIFLGGKISGSAAGQNVSFVPKRNADGTSHLQLNITIPSTYNVSLIVIEDFQ